MTSNAFHSVAVGSRAGSFWRLTVPLATNLFSWIRNSVAASMLGSVSRSRAQVAELRPKPTFHVQHADCRIDRQGLQGLAVVDG